MAAATLSLPAIQSHLELLTKQEAAAKVALEFKQQKLSEIQQDITKYEELKERKEATRYHRKGKL